jgi:hypothetical protein
MSNPTPAQTKATMSSPPGIHDDIPLDWLQDELLDYAARRAGISPDDMIARIIGESPRLKPPHKFQKAVTEYTRARKAAEDADGRWREAENARNAAHKHLQECQIALARKLADDDDA